MLALDLFNTKYERELNEGGVDNLEARRIDTLNDRMQDLVARAKEPAYQANPAALAALKKQFQQVKDERDSYYKVREAGIPGNVPVEKIPGKEDLLKGKGRSYYEATGDGKFDSMMGKISKDPWTQLNSDPNWEYEIEELVDRQIEPWLLTMEKSGMPITRDEETLNPGWRKRYEQVANQLAQKYLTDKGMNPRDPDLVGKIRYAIDSHTDQSRNVHGQLSAYSELPLARYQNDFDADGMTANMRDAMAGIGSRDDDDDDGLPTRPRPDADPRRLDPGNMEEAKWDPLTYGDFPDEPSDDDERAEQLKAIRQYYNNNTLVTLALDDLYRIAMGTSYYDSVVRPEKYLGTIQNQRTGKTEKRYFKSKADAYSAAKRQNAVLVNLEKIDNQEDTSDLITLPVMLGVGDDKKKWMLKFPSEDYAQKWQFKHRQAAQIQWPAGHGLAEDAQDSKSWMTQTRAKYPTAKFMQAKMPGAPIRAYVNGKVVAEFSTDQKKNSALGEKKLGQLRPTLGTGHDVGRSVKKFRAQRGLDEHGGGIGPKQRWQDLMPEQMNPEDYDDYEDEDDRLRSGDYVRDTQDGESGEIFRMQGDPYERRVRILDRDGKGWYIEPSRLTRVDPTDPDVQRYFGRTRVRDMDEAAKKGLYYNVNKRKKAGTSRDAESDKAPTAQAWKDAAKTAKKESVDEVAGAQKCWPGHRKVGTQPGTGKNAGKRVNDCEKIKEDEVGEGWSERALAQRTGQPQTPYAVYIDGRQWKEFPTDDQARAVARKLEAKFRADGSNKKVSFSPVTSKPVKEDQDSSGVESAIIRRIMVAHTDLLKQFGPDKVMQAAEEVAYNVGDVDEVGTSDISAYVAQVRQILGATP